MRFYTIHFAVAPSYRKRFVTVIEAKDRRQAVILLNKKQSKGKRIQVLAVHVSE